MNPEHDNFDPVCEPTIIRFEATFRPAPGFEYLNEVGLGETEPISTEKEEANSGTIIKIRLASGRPLWCWTYLVSSTYANFMVGTPSKQCNDAMLVSVKHEAKQLFGEWPIHIIEPKRTAGEIDYPRTRITAFFKSLPIAHESLSSLVVVWFQELEWPIPDEPGKLALTRIDWERLAVDYSP